MGMAVALRLSRSLGRAEHPLQWHPRKNKRQQAKA
jgi:hypothetical protein